MKSENREAGAIVVAPTKAVYGTVKDEMYVEDGQCYARLRSSNVDDDGDISCYYYDENGEPSIGNYVDADLAEKATQLPKMDVDDELRDKVSSDRTDESHLDVLNEEQQNLEQMQELRSRTIQDGVLYLNVNEVTSAKNSQQWAIVVDHPILGEINFYKEKPISGWTEEYEIVTLMQSYGIHDGNPYKLQQREVVVELVGDDPEIDNSWRLCAKDEYIDTGEVASDKIMDDYDADDTDDTGSVLPDWLWS